MTANPSTFTPAIRPAGRVGQATVVEQSRAVAEVQAAVVVAQQCPRDVQQAVAQMRESCRQPALANKAFFRFSRGSGTVSGPSVHLARELARCWGNFQSGIAELRRDDEAGESEMTAFAWDVQTNSRTSSTFIVPHKRDRSGGPVALTDMRDIYENNANNGARRLREAIFAILPPWFVEEAKDLCNQTIQHGGGKPLAQRIADAINAFDALRVSRDRLERRIGRPSGEWTEHDIAELTVVYGSLNRGEVNVDEEFPAERVTGAEIIGIRPGANAPAQPPATDPSPADAITTQQSRRLHATFRNLGLSGDDKRDERLAVIAAVAMRPITSSSDLTTSEAAVVIDALTSVSREADPSVTLNRLLGRQQGGEEDYDPTTDPGFGSGS